MEAVRLKKKKAITGVAIGMVIAQVGVVLAQIIAKERESSSCCPPSSHFTEPVMWAVAAITVLGTIAAVIVLLSKSPIAHVFIGLGLLIAGVIAGVVILLARGNGPQSAAAATLPVVVTAVAAVAVAVFLGVTRLFVTGTKLSALALPDNLPSVEESSAPVFGKRSGSYGGTSLLNRRVMGIRVPAYGKGYDKRTGGSVWLADEAIAFLPSLSRTPLVIPYALVHALNRKEIDGKPWLSVVWGRPELPMETTIQIAGKSQETDLWAQEISRRTAAWKAKAKAVR